MAGRLSLVSRKDDLIGQIIAPSRFGGDEFTAWSPGTRFVQTTGTAEGVVAEILFEKAASSAHPNAVYLLQGDPSAFLVWAR